MKNKGLLLVLADPVAALEEEFNDWYDTEHLPERAIIDGFETARRYICLGDGPRYAAIYDLTGLEVLDGEAYRAISGANFSPWTRRIAGRVHPARLTARQAGAAQSATGPCTRLLLLKFSNVSEEDLPAIDRGIEDACAATPGFLQARAFMGVEPQPDFILAIAEFAGSHAPPVDIRAFGDCGRKLELAATYRPYR